MWGRKAWGRREGRKQKGGSKRSVLTKAEEQKNCKLGPLSTGMLLSESQCSAIRHLPGTPAQGRPVLVRSLCAVTCQINPRATPVQAHCLPCVGPPSTFRDSTSQLSIKGTKRNS